MENDKIPEEVIDLGDTGPIELPTFNVEEFIGNKVKIAAVSEHKGNFGYFVKIVTEPVDDNGKLKASRVVGLQKDDEDNIGWGAGTKMDILLKKYKVDHYRELVGTEVIVQSVRGKDEKDYLTF